MLLSTHTLLSTLAPKGPRQHCPHCLHNSSRPPAEGSWQLTTAALTPYIFYSSSPRYSLTPTHNIVYTGCPGELPTLSPPPPPCSLHSPLLHCCLHWLIYGLGPPITVWTDYSMPDSCCTVYTQPPQLDLSEDGVYTDSFPAHIQKHPVSLAFPLETLKIIPIDHIWVG